ncbi:MAG TPA: FAD-binding oxidoreductase [Candidatus Acidoferrum sp.]|nr:FAD-binding oxidoreductase [Candidatus Acidoferrum sp.]
MQKTSVGIEKELQGVIAAGAARGATAADCVRGIQPQLVVEPETEAELASALRVADYVGIGVIPRGGGTKLFWGNPPRRADLILSTRRLDKIIEHVWADLTVSVEAGCRIQDLQAALAQHGQRLAIDPLWTERATVGGILSTNDSGTLRLRFGSLRDLVLGVTIALPDGTLATSGGKVVKNVAGYDLPKLVTGALGTLGVITRAVFRLHPLPRYSATLTVSSLNLDALQRLLLAIQDSQLAHTSLQVRTASEAGANLDIRIEGTEEGISAQVEQFRALIGATRAKECSADVWNSLREVWVNSESAALAKITTLPASIAETIEHIAAVARKNAASWKLVMQATGVGTVRLEASQSENLRAGLLELRAAMISGGGALVIQYCPAEMESLDACGQPSDAISLMQAIKKQFDPRGTLNPGRFLGNI